MHGLLQGTVYTPLTTVSPPFPAAHGPGSVHVSAPWWAAPSQRQGECFKGQASLAGPLQEDFGTG